MPFKRPKQIFTIPPVHTTCLPTIAFIYEDQLLSSKPPKRLLCVIIFVCVCVYQINMILLDEGLSVNSLLTYITKELEVSMDELSKSSLIIQGLYQGGQKRIDVIRLSLMIEVIPSQPLFHVIKAKT